MKSLRLAALAILLPLAGFGSPNAAAGQTVLSARSHGFQLAEAETGAGEHSVSDDARNNARSEAANDGAGTRADDDGGVNWLAWLVGLPLLAGLILLVLLLTRGKRPGREDGKNE